MILRKPSGVYISRRATVGEYHRKVAEILFDSQKTRTLEELLAMSRIWRLDTGESVLDVEDEFKHESAYRLPIQVKGRILKNEEFVENINVADIDILMYEVQVMANLKSNN